MTVWSKRDTLELKLSILPLVFVYVPWCQTRRSENVFLEPRRIDEPVAAHLEKEGVEFLQFAFRWVNCLLLRELPFHLALRLWDTYLAEGETRTL